MSRLFPLFALAMLAPLLAGCAQGRSAPDFMLTDDNGQSWNLSAQHGKTVLLTFGFTHCVDTCPATLAKLARLSGAFGSRAKDIEIAFVTVDPQRDTPSALHRYLTRFDTDRIVGLTGTLSQIETVENAYHVWAQKIPGKRGTGNYDEAHSAVIYFIDANGRIRSLHDDDDSSATLGNAMRAALG